ncbi:HD domain-containing protein [Moritella dasanensis]|jgi:phosphonate degradation associated HDIG domain protein|uniref:HD domain-containing protein n=1 Tax=Moritella dasanensis TaxID=428031 RepID=UPI00031FF237|nr:HD domain-containing protein [Moritella dasanensis]
MDIIAFIKQQFEDNGHVAYGENISMGEHMLQSAYYAEQKNSSDAIITAALLHDFGHLILELPEDIAEHGIDGYHEDVGAKFLAPYFPKQIIDGIALHVQAKRYLCAVKPKYHSQLSQASQDSLVVQGGAMNAQDISEFEQLPFYKDALQVRLFDDLGKDLALEHPDLAHYLRIAQQFVMNKPPVLLSTEAF